MCPEDDIEQTWSKWEKYFMSVMHQCIPTVTVNRNSHWLTYDLVVAIRSQNFLYRQSMQDRETNTSGQLQKEEK